MTTPPISGTSSKPISQPQRTEGVTPATSTPAAAPAAQVDGLQAAQAAQQPAVFKPRDLFSIDLQKEGLVIGFQNLNPQKREAIAKLPNLTLHENTFAHSTEKSEIKALLYLYNLIPASIPVASRQAVHPKGLHVPTGAVIPQDIKTQLERGEITFESLSPEHKKAVTLTVDSKDIFPLPEGTKEEARSPKALFTPDGKGFPYTFLPQHTASRLGVPYIVPTQDQTSLIGNVLGSSPSVTQDIDPKSIKQISYIDPSDDPKTAEPKTGIYFELTETKDGKTVINGVIVKEGIEALLVVDDSHDGQGRKLFHVPIK